MQINTFSAVFFVLVNNVTDWVRVRVRSVSRLGLLIGNRWMSWLQDRSCCSGLRANYSLHATVGGALSETVATVSLSTVPRLSLLSGQSCC